ncbi:hypothetical protein KOW79_005589 [Hemibagrus wyckioides]|uniref:Uncharacterized protein n=1 Tax=Hemibagrus wyckioides TaxID=337641 RepID=A0A9D3P2A1_9TELE|nr:hypothetical protein KOW79_005589 [Hemibagrus wyckioides]
MLVCTYAMESRFPDVWTLTGEYMAVASGDRWAHLQADCYTVELSLFSWLLLDAVVQLCVASRPSPVHRIPLTELDSLPTPNALSPEGKPDASPHALVFIQKKMKKRKKEATLDRSWVFHLFFLLRSWHGSGLNRRHGGLIPAREQATDTLTDSQGRKEPGSALS